MTAINLGRGSPTRLGATYPPTLAEPQVKSRGVPRHSALAYLVLLRVEIARFTRHKNALSVALEPTRLCCSNPHLTVERCYLLRCPVQSGRSSSAGFPHSDFSIAVSFELHQRRSSVLHAIIIGAT